MTDIEVLEKEIRNIRNDIKWIKDKLKEDYELSESAEEELRIARETPDSEYVDLE